MTEPSRPPQTADDKHRASEFSEGTTLVPAPGKGDKKELTPEEQMALYEKELKETDWGHQPC